MSEQHMLSSSEGLFRKRFGPQERTILEMGALVFFAKEQIRAQDLDQNTRNYANEALAAIEQHIEGLEAEGFAGPVSINDLLFHGAVKMLTDCRKVAEEIADTMPTPKISREEMFSTMRTGMWPGALVAEQALFNVMVDQEAEHLLKNLEH
jgi:hypothetical protein